MTAPSVKWSSLEAEVRGLLVLTVRSKGCLPHSTAAALNVLAQPTVVQKYKLRGNRWTEPNNSRLDSVDGAAGCVEDEDAPLLDDETLRVLQAAKEEFTDNMAQRSTAEWLQALGAAMDEPMADRPWFYSGESHATAAAAADHAAACAAAHSSPGLIGSSPLAAGCLAPLPCARAGGAWLAVGGVALLLLFHVFILHKVLGRLSLLDDRQGRPQGAYLVLLPAIGLAAASCVGGFAVLVHRRI